MFISQKKKLFLVSLLFFCLLPIFRVEASAISDRLSGRILLQVESYGEAYYINPIDKKKYYLGRPNDAFNIMRSFGLGVSNSDLLNFIKNKARPNLAGRILLQVEDKGQAYYINPTNLNLYYLGRPADAFNIMRQLGLGISNSDLSQIPLGYLAGYDLDIPETIKVGPEEKLVKFSWKYKNKQYTLDQVLNTNIYNEYKNSSKTFYYSGDNPPENLRDSYYGIFLTLKSSDDYVEKLLISLKKIADRDGFDDDEFLEFVMSFVQYIPYDSSKLETSPQNFPYETLYKNSGICSDKAFLALLMLRKMGYGGAIFDYPNSKHSAVAVACSGQSSYNSGYCFIETTNYFPVGVFPGELSGGQARLGDFSWEDVFDGQYLGLLEVYQQGNGRIYGGMTDVVNMVSAISKMETAVDQKETELNLVQQRLDALSDELDQLLVKINEYNQNKDYYNYNLSVAQYNIKVAEYNSTLDEYNLKTRVYNDNLALLNKMVKDFYQN
ncbi:MAG: transglutaminase-like domain-containing protein [Patescibacteria group bacterium]|jgi:hypothetical protein